MFLVKTTFQGRVNEINLYFTFINSYIPTNTDEDLNRILKSNMILMLYNLVESSISNAIEEIHNHIHVNSTSFDILKGQLKAVIIKHLKKRNPKEFVDSVTDIAIDIIKRSFNRETMFNGNVDAQRIRDLSKEYGFSFNTTYAQTKNGASLLTIKSKRNDLAHGTFSFVEVGKEYSPQDIEKMKNETIHYLTEIINNIESYLNNQDYIQVLTTTTTATNIAEAV